MLKKQELIDLNEKLTKENEDLFALLTKIIAENEELKHIILDPPEYNYQQIREYRRNRGER